ncbi:MAG: beta strand repeat-containing protein [Actinomycetes bacterium]
MYEHASSATPSHRGRFLALLTFFGALATVVLFGMLHSTANAAVACTHYWKSTVASGDWGTASNWSPNATGTTSSATSPGATSGACLQTGAAPAITLSVGNPKTIVAANLTAGSLTINSGVILKTTDAVNTSVINNLQLNGTLSGTAVNLTGPSTNFVDGSTLLGSVKTVAVGATATIQGTVYIGNTGSTAANQGLLTNSGTLSWVGAGYIYLGGGTGSGASGLTNTGAFNVVSNFGYYVYDNSGGGSAPLPKFLNSGSVNVNGSPTAYTAIYVPFDNTGSVTVTGGAAGPGNQSTLYVYGSNTSAGTDSGSYNAGANNSVYFGNNPIRRMTASASVTGTGGLTMDSGTLTITGTPTFSHLTLTGGIVSGSESIGTLDWTGGTFDQAGTTTVTGTSNVTNSVSLDNAHVFTNNGTANVANAYTCVNNGAHWMNEGTVNFTGDGPTFEQCGTSGFGTNEAFINDVGKTVNYTADTPAGNLDVYIPNSNAGTINLIEGTFQDVDPNSNIAGFTTDTGNFNISPGATYHVSDAGYVQTRTFAASATFTGLGAFQVSGATAALNGQTIPNLVLDGGVITGNESVTSLTWTYGTFDQAGTTTVTGTANVTNNAYLDHGHVFTNSGTANLNNAYTCVNNGAHWLNEGTVNFTGDGSAFEQCGTSGLGTNEAFINDVGKTVNFTADTTGGYLYTNIPNSNLGTFNVNKGTWYDGDPNSNVAGFTTDSGTLNLAFGTVMQITDVGYGQTRTFSSSATVSGLGSLQVDSATVAFNGTSISNANVDGGTLVGSPTIGNLTISGGTQSGSPNVTNLTFSGGVMDGAGTTTATGSVNFSGTQYLDHGHVLLLSASSTTTKPNNGYVQLYGGSELENAGAFNITGDGGYEFYNEGAGATASFQNDATGTLTYTAATTTPSGVFYSYVPVSNAGTINAAKGQLQDTIDNGLSGGTLTGGTYIVGDGASTASLYLPGPVTTNAATIVIGNKGSLVDNNVGTANSAIKPMTTNHGSLTVKQNLAFTGNVANDGAVALGVSGTLVQLPQYTQTGSTSSLTVPTGTTLQSNGSGKIVNVSAGTVSGNGMITGKLTSSGTVSPSVVVGGTALTVNGTLPGTYTQTAGGKLAVTINGKTTAGVNFSQLSVTGPTSLNGQLAITTGYTPVAGDAVTIVSAPGGITGAFSSITGDDIAGTNLYWDVVPTSTSVQLVAKAVPTLSVGSPSVQEPGSATTTVNVPVTLTDPSLTHRTVTVHWSTSDGAGAAGAVSPADYTGTSGTLTFTPGTTVQNAVVTIQSDSLDEFDETFAVTLDTPSKATIASGGGTGTVTILDDPNDLPPTVSIGNVTQAEGNSGTTTFNFPVTLSAASGKPISVNYSTTDGTATAPSDYTAVTNQTVNIPAGTTSVNAPVSVNGDTTVEPDETFTVTISTPVNVTLGTTSATGTITNDDSGSSVTVTGVSPSALGQGAKSKVVTVTGTGFVSGATVSMGGGLSLASQTFVNSTTMTVKVTVATNALPGTRDVTVTNPGGAGSGTCFGCFTVNARPVMTSFSPNQLATGASKVNVTVTGTGFESGKTTIKFNPAGVTGKVTFISSTQLKVAVTVTQTAPLTTYSPVLTNPDYGLSQPCGNCFAVVDGPHVTGISPSSVARGSSNIAVTITGTNFTGGTPKIVGPKGTTWTNVVIVNSTTITATLAVSSTATTGSNQAVTVTETAAVGSGASTFNGLTIT